MPDLRELVDELPTEALELYVQEYEGMGVGTYYGCSLPISVRPRVFFPRCPRASLGYLDSEADRRGLFRTSKHPADVVERLALAKELDTDALYRECLLAIAERDGVPEREVAHV
ncbi:MAG: hypothetical protein ACOC9H_01960 [Gemmatimonadota bacterium]